MPSWLTTPCSHTNSTLFYNVSSLHRDSRYFVNLHNPEAMKRTLILSLALATSLCSIAGNKTYQRDAFRTAMRGFYLWRCGTAVSGEHNGIHYHTDACHLEDGYTAYVDADAVKLTEAERQANTHRRDGSGGWHDAGDYGKYTVNAGITMASLFYAWDHFGSRIRRVSLDLPETAPGYPQFLKELKWESDFLLKMEYPDHSGRVSHKLTRINFSGFIMPQEDDGKRYFTVWSSAATANYAATMAMASRYFAPYDKAYANQCLTAAIRSYTFLKAHPKDKPFLQGDFQTGGYGTHDADDRLWAAAELWEATGEKVYLNDLEQQLQTRRKMIDSDWDWGNVSNLGVYTYILSKREGRSPELVARIRKAVIDDADAIATRIANDAYGCPLEKYYWGCNGTAARLAINLHVADMLSHKSTYKKSIQRISDYLLGNNGYGRSFVTGVGVNPPMHPHDRRSGADGIEAPWPGYLVGGGHSATDWVDNQDDYSRNEIAINWQGALVYLLAATL